MAEAPGNVFDLGRTFKVIGTNGRISGEWVALIAPSRPSDCHITPHHVVIYDEGFRSGIVVHPDDLRANVKDGVVDLWRVTDRVGDDVEVVRAELLELLAEIARVANTDRENGGTKR